MEQAYQDDTFQTGTDPVVTTTGTVASGQNLAKYAPLGQVTATGEFKEWAPGATDGTEVAVRIAPFAIDASLAAKKASLIKSGTFNPELIDWPDGTTDAQKLVAFVGTPISLQLPNG